LYFTIDDDEYLNTNYEIYDYIASGGFGDILLARSKTGANSGKSYALKKIPKCDSQKNDLLSEVKILSLISTSIGKNKNLLGLVDVFQTQKNLYLVMEEMVCSLTYLINTPEIRVLLSTENILYVFKEIIRGFANLRRLNILHSDVKPDNMLINDDGEIFVTDFGTSEVLTEEQPISAFTKIGSPGFMSPEMCLLVPNKIQFQSDVFSLGLLFYEIYGSFKRHYTDLFLPTIKKPLTFASNVEAIIKILQKEIASTHPELFVAIKNSLQMNPDNRIDIFSFEEIMESIPFDDAQNIEQLKKATLQARLEKILDGKKKLYSRPSCKLIEDLDFENYINDQQYLLKRAQVDEISDAGKFLNYLESQEQSTIIDETYYD